MNSLNLICSSRIAIWRRLANDGQYEEILDFFLSLRNNRDRRQSNSGSKAIEVVDFQHYLLDSGCGRSWETKIELGQEPVIYAETSLKKIRSRRVRMSTDMI